VPGEKPIARKTPYSVVRSRTPMAMVLPRIIVMMARMMTLTTSMRGENRREGGHERVVHRLLAHGGGLDVLLVEDLVDARADLRAPARVVDAAHHPADLIAPPVGQLSLR
jgi:hypothetical protein